MAARKDRKVSPGSSGSTDSKGKPRTNSRAAAATGLGAAAVAAGAALGAVAVERSARQRKLLDGLDGSDGLLGPTGFDEQPDHVRTVIASDGVALHVEIDDPLQGDSNRNDGSRTHGSRIDSDQPLTVVFSHGFTLNLDSWVFQRRALKAAGYRVVLWDQRSHGRSGMSDGEHATLGQLGRDLHDVIEATTPTGDLVLVGHSMGGMTVMSLARQFPELVRDRVIAVALVATSAGGGGLTSLDLGPTFGQFAGRVGPTVLNRLGRYAAPLGRLRRFGRKVEDVFVERYSFDSPVSQQLVRFTGDMIFGTTFEAMGQFLPALDTLDEEAALANFVGVETVIINGEGDLLTPPDHSARIAEHVPGAEHVVVHEAGHLIMLEHPELVSEQLRMVIERGVAARGRRIDVTRKPRVRRVITDLTRRRKVAKAAKRGAKRVTAS